MDPWGDTAATILRTEMTKRRLTYADLVAQLAKLGIEENERNLRNKVMRGTFSAGFFLMCLTALRVDTLQLVDWSAYRYVDDDGRRYRLDSLGAMHRLDPRGTRTYEVMGVTREWRYPREVMARFIEEGRVVQPRPGAEPRLKRYQDESPGLPTAMRVRPVRPPPSGADDEE
jgi:Domain of unknown function (DUF6471)